MTVNELRDKYPIFEYKSFEYELEEGNLVCSWKMEAGELKYNPKLTLHNVPSNLNISELDNLVFHVGLADIFSYWKPTCSPLIKISAGKLTDDQLSWWTDLLIKGMGQYFYTNQIDFKQQNFIKMESSGPTFPQSEPENPGLLIPVGGGKDSAVTLELLKDQPHVGAFAMNVSWSDTMLPAAKRLMNEAGIKEQIFVHRQMDKKLWELKQAGFLDGHIPFSAYMDFLTVLIARVYGFSEVAFSNERSSNEGNLEYLGVQINHQYSKSYEFETKFKEYSSKYLSKVNTFSFLRPLYELQIMKLFSQAAMSKYYTQFRSCNIGYKNDSWCGACPKCLSVFVGLFPFVKTETLLQIFGQNLFEDPKLLELTKDVLGLGVGKPFECIGTFEETVVAFYLSKMKLDGQNLPPVLAYFADHESILEKRLGNLESLSNAILGGFDDSNGLPSNYAVILKKALKND